MLKIGNHKISDVYYGSLAVKKILIGENVVFSKAEMPPEPSYTVSASVSPAGGGTVTGSGEYPEGTSVTLRATPRAGMMFVCWKDLDAENALPEGYIPVEYIQSSGNQYINIGQFEPNYRIVMDCEMENTTGNLIGTSVPLWFLMWCYNGINVNVFSSGDTLVNPDTTMPIRIKADIDSATSRVTINGITKEVTTTSTKKTLPGLTLFARSTGVNSSTGEITAAAQYTNGMKLYSCKVYSDAGNLVHNFSPCLDPSGIPGLYDLAGNTFLKSSTSTNFIAGEILNNNPGYTLTIDSDKHFQAVFASELGIGYIQLEYVESPGSAYISTLHMSSTAKMVIDLETTEMPTSGNYHYIAYAYSRSTLSGGRYQHRGLAVSCTPTYIGGYLAAGSSSSTNSSFSFSKLTENATPRRMSITIDYETQKLSLDDVSIDFSSGNVKNYAPNAYVSVLGTSVSEAYTVKAKLYGIKYYINGELEYDFVPCVAPNGVVGVYDKGNDIFRASVTSTPLIAGPTV